MEEKNIDPGRTRTCNPLIRSQMPYPLGHRAKLVKSVLNKGSHRVIREFSRQ